jgi:hypothetical protein
MSSGTPPQASMIELNQQLTEKMVDMCFEQLRPTTRRFGPSVDSEIGFCFSRFMLAVRVIAES